MKGEIQMREEVERIMRWEKADEDFNNFYLKFRNADEELSDIQYHCKHEIIVFPFPIAYCSPRKCLFCGRENIYLGNVGDPILIYNYKSDHIYGLSPKKRFEIVKKLFIKIAEENPEMELSQITKRVQDEINHESEDFKKFAHEEYK